MFTVRRWLLVGSPLIQAGCAVSPRHPVATAAAETNWACRYLDTRRQDRSTGATSGNGLIEGTTCLVSRS